MKKILYAQIEKSEPQDDGTVKVYGYASSPSMDSDGETVTPEAIAAALPDYMKFGAVREMHQPKAAGTAIEAKVMDDGRTWFGAHVVDSEAVKKIQAKVYKGFSIGGKVLARSEDDENIITELKLVEVSLVDRPANPDAVFTMYKAEDLGEPAHKPEELDAIKQLSSLVNKGAIVPSKLVELAQEFIKGEKDVQKSFWDVAELARLLGCLKSIQSSVAFEAAYEGEESDISNRLKANIMDLAATLVAMVGEEAAEMASATSVDVVEMKASADSDKVAKADDAEEGDDEDKAKEDAKKDDDVEDDDDPKKADSEDDDDKATDANDGHTTQPKKKSEGTDDLAKALGGDDILAKFAGLVKAEVGEALEPINKRLAHLEGQPAPSKAVLKTVGKADDVSKADDAVGDSPPAGLTPEQEAAWEIKKMHRTGGLI